MRNLGNTCFAAAAVRALGSSPRSAAALVAKAGDFPLARAVLEVLGGSREAWPGVSRELDRLINRRRFEPHDSHELLCALVDHLRMERHFAVALATRVACCDCGLVIASRETAPFATCEPAPGASVASGLAAAREPRPVEGRECERCGGSRSIMQTLPGSAPEVLAVRVAACAGAGAGETTVEDEIAFAGRDYRSRAVILFEGGHYACAARSPPDEAGRGWTLFDDDRAAPWECAGGCGGRGGVRAPGVHTVLYDRVPRAAGRRS